MLLRRLLCLAAAAVSHTNALVLGGKPGLMIQNYERDPLQNIVTWDNETIFVRGERVLFYSGEYHPFRLPVPGLWLDVFQKIKALGYNGVSFYVDWALVEGKPGHFSAEGVFDLEPFFEAASTAGIYLLARPGPYINAEVSGGGFPGWLERNPASYRTRDPAWLAETANYVKSISAIIAKAQITNGGPVILFQPENEYSQGNDPNFPDPVYWAAVQDMFRDSGIVLPFISNDAAPHGYFAPGHGNNVSVDIYGHDGYPLGFDCANPTTWPDNNLPTNYRTLHNEQSPTTPYSIVEFQGGSFDPWGGLGFEQCAQLLNSEFERVFYKDIISFGATIFNIYMTYGGTNWGNLGHPGGYTSYDYGAVITEDRLVSREKYSQAKLIANFLQVSPAYLTAIPQSNANAKGAYTNNSAIFVTALFGKPTKFYVVRHSAYNSLDTTSYKFTATTSQGNITVPQLGAQLSLHGRDSKVYVSDYDVGGINLLYSSAEIFTWKKYGDKTVLIVYGGPGEQHELAVSNGGKASIIEGQDVKIEQRNKATVLNFAVSPNRRIVELSNGLQILILDRGHAYNYWTISLPSDSTTGNFTNAKSEESALIVRTEYLLRTAELADDAVHLTGDLNATSQIEVIGAPTGTKTLTFNGKTLQIQNSAPSYGGASTGIISATATYEQPELNIPDLSAVQWKSVDSLPEIQSSYDDAAWTVCSNITSANNYRNLTTPTSLYADDYGYHGGSLIYRGHFNATGEEKTFAISTQGGSAFGHSVWLDDTFLGSFAGADVYENTNASYTLPANLTAGKSHVLTVLIDHMGIDENGAADIPSPGKSPRGIINYKLGSTPITWKMTGNLGGEDFRDPSRGPLNEGAMYAERQGYHLPGAPFDTFQDSKGPNDGFTGAGVKFYATKFNLDMPQGYDIPLSLSFNNATASLDSSGEAEAYRVQLFVNGWQFGKYVHNIGPQDVFPVPEGIWNYRGENYLALTLWSLEAAGAKTADFKLVAGPIIQTGYGNVELSPGSKWEKREGAY